MSYIDGYVIPIPRKQLKAYSKMARLGAAVWMDHGALEYRECIGDDLAVKFGATFPKSLKLKAGETVIFAWVVYKSRAHRDRVNKKVMSDPRMNMSAVIPFDTKRMLFGGFKVLVERP